MIINFFSFYFLIFLLNIIPFTINYIILPFKTYIDKPGEDPKKGINTTLFFENYFSNKIYSSIEIGNPKKVIPIEITSSSYGLIIGYLCDKNYNKDISQYNNNSSKTFFREYDGLITFQQYEGGYYGKDSFTFLTDLKDQNNEITINNISFIYMPKTSKSELIKSSNKICGILGLSLKYYNYCEEQRNLITNLNKLNIIHNYAYSIHYKDDNNGFIIIGEEPHNVISDKFDEDILRRTNALSDGYDSVEWKTEFTQIYFYDNGEKKKLTETKRVKFAIEINYMIGTNNYKKNMENYFFGNYLEQNICHYEKIQNKRYSILICDDVPSFDIDSFPSIFLYHRIFNYTFELTKDELFLKKDNKYIFLVFFSDYDIKYYVLGKIFLKKYLLVFNQDTKTIGFYNNELKMLKNEKYNILYIIIVTILTIICSIIGFYLAKKIYENNRRTRINEINEQYEYKSNEKNINDESNDKNKILLEMPSK